MVKKYEEYYFLYVLYVQLQWLPAKYEGKMVLLGVTGVLILLQMASSILRMEFNVIQALKMPKKPYTNEIKRYDYRRALPLYERRGEADKISDIERKINALR